MAAPTVAVVGSWSGGSVTTYTMTLPGGVAENDIVLLFVETDDQTPPTPSTYAEITAARASRSGGTRGTWFWKRSSGSESDPQFGMSGLDHVAGVPLYIRGCRTTGDPWHVVGSPNDGITDPGTTAVTIPALTTTVNDCLVIMAVAGGNDTAAAQFSSPANATLTNFTEQANAGAASGNGGGGIVCSGVRTGQGSSGNFTATHSGDDNWAGCQVAFDPPIVLPSMRVEPQFATPPGGMFW